MSFPLSNLKPLPRPIPPLMASFIIFTCTYINRYSSLNVAGLHTFLSPTMWYWITNQGHISGEDYFFLSSR